VHGASHHVFGRQDVPRAEEDLGYVPLTNSANGQGMAEAVERRVFGRDIGR